MKTIQTGKIDSINYRYKIMIVNMLKNYDSHYMIKVFYRFIMLLTWILFHLFIIFNNLYFESIAS